MEVPLQVVVQELSRLRAGVVYYPQHFCDRIASVAFRDMPDRDVLVPAIEGLELALVIANRLALNFSVYDNEQTTICSIQAAAQRRLQQLES
jgi:hypothetical protein